MRRSSLGPLIKAKETLKVFARSAPSPRTLWANRNQHFEQLHAILPSTATPGEPLQVTLQAWDQCERLIEGFEGSVTIDATDPDADHPASVSFDPADDGLLTVPDITFNTAGTHFLTFTYDGQRFVANPVLVADDHDQHIYWGDIHLHSNFSDGTSQAEAGYRFGRDVMALDVVAYTDHDTMGFFIPPKWQRDRMQREYFDRLCAIADEFNDDGTFVTLPAYEWTKQPNMGGHVNVYFEDADDAFLFDSLATDSRTYEQLWTRLREWDHDHDSGVVTVPHHPAEAMYPFDFDAVDFDDEFAPLVEVYSQWGSSERRGRDGNEFPLAMGQGEIDEPGHYVSDAHRMGHRVGMLGGADFHGPQPGHSLIHTSPHLPSLAEWCRGGLGWGNIWRVWAEHSYPGGLTAFLAPDLSRSAIFEALRSRSVYATTQPHRILVDFSVNGVDVATQTDRLLVDAPETPREIAIDVAGTAPIDRVTVRKNDAVWHAIDGTDDPAADLETYTVSATLTDDAPLAGMTWDDDRGTDGDVYTLQVRQATATDFAGMAWVGPIWVEPR